MRDRGLVHPIVVVGVELVGAVAGLGVGDDATAQHAPRILFRERRELGHVGADDVDETGAVVPLSQRPDPPIFGVEGDDDLTVLADAQPGRGDRDGPVLRSAALRLA